MHITKVSIANFKALKSAHVELGSFNVIVGANGSGKSSILQALHWMLQSGRNLTVETNKDTAKGSTLSEKDAIYMPSPDYKEAAHGDDYGNFNGSRQLDVNVVGNTDEGDEFSASMWIRAARNEGVSVHVPSGNAFVARLRDRKREISAYIPGVAGIALSEEKRSKVVVHRLAAAGDANTVLRNVLDLLSEEEVDGVNALRVVESYVSRVMGNFRLRVEFDDEKDTRIKASFQTSQIAAEDPKSFKPLELAGIGFLQVLQIFAYLVHFRPALLLVDEPDAHLYPVAQERLVVALSEAASALGAQVLMTTHSPSIVRALPEESRVIWMKGGEVQPESDTDGRQLMGWGLLDRRIVLMTEDKQNAMLRQLLEQWPDLERVTAIWPFNGTGKLPNAETLAGVRSLFGEHVKIVVHRDRDFMLPDELALFAKPYEARGISVWATRFSDMESYWCEAAVLEAHFGLSSVEVATLLAQATADAQVDEKDLKLRRKKRLDFLNKITDPGAVPQFSDLDVQQHYEGLGQQHVVMGKELLKRIRETAQTSGLHGASSLGKQVPTGMSSELAQDLAAALRAVLS
ncbi:ATP-dependent nuclease [Microbacterium sp. M1A1_1b]